MSVSLYLPFFSRYTFCRSLFGCHHMPQFLLTLLVNDTSHTHTHTHTHTHARTHTHCTHTHNTHTHTHTLHAHTTHTHTHTHTLLHTRASVNAHTHTRTTHAYASSAYSQQHYIFVSTSPSSLSEAPVILPCQSCVLEMATETFCWQHGPTASVPNVREVCRLLNI